MTKCPSLYNIVRKKNASVAQVLSTTPLNVSFRRALMGDDWAKWLDLVGSILGVRLGEQTEFGLSPKVSLSRPCITI
jgi:hypothetical protein